MNSLFSTNKKVADLFKQGRWNSALVQEALDQAENSQKTSNWIRYLDICQSICGITLPEWLHVVEQCREHAGGSHKLSLRLSNLMHTPGIIENPGVSERQRYLSLVNPGAQCQLLKNLSDISSTGYLGSRLPHYPGLIRHTIDELGIKGHSGSGSVALETMATLLHEKTTPFSQLTRQHLPGCSTTESTTKAIRIAVVGNSPTIMNREQGNEIDAADLVIRFNNVSIDAHTHKFTGERTDLWVMSPSTPVSQCPFDARAVIVSGLNALTRPSFYWKTLAGLDKPLSQFPSHIWYKLVGHFQAPPSAGTLFIASLEEYVDNAQIHCYGFSTDKTDCEQLSNHHSDNQPRSNRHNWNAEIDWLTQQSAQGKALIVASQ